MAMLSMTKAIPEYSRHSIENCCYRAVYMGWLFNCREVLNHLLLHRRKMSFQHSQNIWMRVHCSRVHSWLMYQGRPLMRNISRNRYNFNSEVSSSAAKFCFLLIKRLILT